MNTIVILTLAIGFALLTFLLLCLCLYGTLGKRWKWLLVLLVSASYFVGYNVLRESQGWAAAEVLPPKFILLATVIDEPVKDKHKGEIYLWLQPMVDNRPSGEPRAYRLPYAKDLHTLFEEGMKKIRRGNSQMGSTEPRPGSRGLTWLLPANNDTQRIRLRDVPASQLPEK